MKQQQSESQVPSAPITTLVPQHRVQAPTAAGQVSTRNRQTAHIDTPELALDPVENRHSRSTQSLGIRDARDEADGRYCSSLES